MKTFIQSFGKLGFFTLVLFSLVVSSVFCGGSSDDSANDGKGKSGTITVIGNANELAAVKAAMELYNVENPNVKLETIIASNATAFETAMTAKIASNDLPDLMVMQVNSLLGDYAHNGYIRSVDSFNIQDTLINGEVSLIKYNDEFYGIPLSVNSSGFYLNNEVLEEYGVTVDVPPRDMDEFLDLCQELRDAGLESPIALAAKDSSTASAFVFTYIYQQVYGRDSNWYANVLRGEDGWDGDNFASTFDAYAQLVKYANKDMLGTDKSGAVKRFVTGEAAIILDYVSLLKDIRQITPDLDTTFCPPPFVQNHNEQTAITNFDSAVVISSKNKNPELVDDFYQFMFKGEAYDAACTQGTMLPTIIGANVPVDPAMEFLVGKLSDGMPTCAMLSREWIPGVKEVMKKNAQDYLAGTVNGAEASRNIEVDHQRLMAGNPDYVTTFLDTYVDK